MSELKFCEEAHTYHLHGRELPSVTQIISGAGLISDFAKNNNGAMERGTVVHKCCALLAQGKLDWDTVDTRVIRYVEGYSKFLAENRDRFLPDHVEEPLADEILGYAGTPDAWNGLLVVDIKTGESFQPWFGVQLAAYERLIGGFHSRFTVLLKADGSYALKEWTSRNDMKVFQSCLTLWLFKEGRL